MVSDACVVCDSPAACKAHESCCRHDEPQIAPAEQPVRDAYTLRAPDVAALVKRFGERARGANDNAQRGGDADAQVWSIVAQDYRDARAALAAKGAGE